VKKTYVCERAKRIRPIVAFLCLGAWTMGSALAQHTNHTAAAADASGNVFPLGTIDGSINPDQIPDLTAYRLIFRAFAEPPNATQDQMTRQRAKLAAAGIPAADLNAFFVTLADFEVLYQNFLSSQTGVVDFSKLIAARDQIVTDTLTSLKGRASADGMLYFQALVQNEKRHMIVSPPSK
jgi:hypothetical protein